MSNEITRVQYEIVATITATEVTLRCGEQQVSAPRYLRGGGDFPHLVPGDGASPRLSPLPRELAEEVLGCGAHEHRDGQCLVGCLTPAAEEIITAAYRAWTSLERVRLTTTDASRIDERPRRAQ